ncbi:MAG: thiol-disulfide oxidoreductase DCC family protein [Phycisphaerales bacterium]
MHDEQYHEAAAQEGGPILLFDGVCNLCNASVNFVIDRDPKSRFRFASLQSDAAKRALQRAGVVDDLPDSVVLIDRTGVHTQSTAALRVARRLGPPWSLLAIFLIVPRAIRDPLYAWIARNRYRWFGRQTACRIPTPDLKDRFLDAGEPAHIVEPGAHDPATREPASLGLGTLPTRFLLVYPIIFMLPFPLMLVFVVTGGTVSLAGQVLPESSAAWLAQAQGAIVQPFSWLMAQHTAATQGVVGWFGELVTGAEPSFTMTGSGDGVASYLGVLFDFVIAAVIAVAWWVWRRSKPISPRVADGARVLLRYYLAYMMFAYGFAKVFPLQFPGLGPDRLLQPFGDASPMGLLWTFMGASAGYQIFAGAAEVLGGLLLLFRRTTLLGSLVVAAVMTNVFAMNMFFDVPVKLYSFHYLVFAIVLAIPDLPRLTGLFIANIPVAPRDLRPFWGRSRWLNRAVGVVKFVLIGLLLYTNISGGFAQMRTRGPWAPAHPLRAVYTVESFAYTDDQPAAPAEHWVRVGLNPPGIGTVQRADGTAVRMRMRIDDEAQTLTLYDRGLSEPPAESLAFERLDDGALRLAGVFEGRLIDVTIRPMEVESLLQSRGFRWINEYPYNR